MIKTDELVIARIAAAQKEANKLLVEVAEFPTDLFLVWENIFLANKTRMISVGCIEVVADFSEVDLIRLRGIVADVKNCKARRGFLIPDRFRC